MARPPRKTKRWPPNAPNRSPPEYLSRSPERARPASTATAVWRNEPGQVHMIEAVEDSVVVEVSTSDLDDVVRLTDDYGRAGTTAP